MARILREIVPVVGIHEIEFCPPVLAVESTSTDFISFWWKDSPDIPKERRKFIIVGTGHEFDDRLEYVATVERDHNGLVWHLMSGPRTVVSQ